MKKIAFLFTLAVATPTLAMADDKANTKTETKPTDKAATLSADDLKVVAHVKHVNDMEIEMGKLAQANGGAAAKKYGKTLVTDHTANNTKLTALAKKKGVTAIPADEPMTDVEKADHQKMMDGMAKLKTLKAAEFDREFFTMMIDAHDQTVGKLDAGIASVKDADVVAHLKATKPVVQKHADTARAEQKKLGAATSMK